MTNIMSINNLFINNLFIHKQKITMRAMWLVNPLLDIKDHDGNGFDDPTERFNDLKIWNSETMMDGKSVSDALAKLSEIVSNLKADGVLPYKKSELVGDNWMNNNIFYGLSPSGENLPDTERTRVLMTFLVEFIDGLRSVDPNFILALNL